MTSPADFLELPKLISTKVSTILFAVLSGMIGLMLTTASHAEVVFNCPAQGVSQVQSRVESYFSELGISASLYEKSISDSKVTYQLTTPEYDTTTLYLKYRPEFGIKEETVQLPGARGKLHEVTTVSRKEIVLALLQHGRTTTLQGKECDVQALVDHVGIRQNTVAWAEDLEWGWPDGGSASWNKKYWNRGTLVEGASLNEAMTDIFVNRSKYGIGCYTATKFIMIQGVLDYYHRVKKDKAMEELVTSRLMADKEALVDIEPGLMWKFEADFDPAELTRPGKILSIQHSVAPGNFVPGDWSYFLNTDPVSYAKTGYEGSNAVYLGRNSFNDHYNDNDHHYTYHEKLAMVYQWRNGVFSRSRDYAKIMPLTGTDFNALERTPGEGGLLFDFRVSPYFFGYQELPVLSTDN